MSGNLSAQNGIDGEVTVSFHGNVAVVTIDRGENRFNLSFLDAMHTALDKVQSNPDVQVMVTTGKGRFYSNGLDLIYISYQAKRPERDDFLKEFWTRINRFLIRLVEFPLVTVAAINGHAFAAGAVLALAHDYRVMNNEKGWFCLNEVHLGLHVGPFFQELIDFRMLSGRVYNEVLVFGRRHTAEEAKKDRIVECLCSQRDLVETASSFGKGILPKNGYNRKYLQEMKKNVLGRKMRNLQNDPGLVKSNL